MKDKIFYKLIIKIFSVQVQDYFNSRIPQITYGVGTTVPLNTWTHISSGNSISKAGVIKGSSKDKWYTSGWNDCVEEMKRRII